VQPISAAVILEMGMLLHDQPDIAHVASAGSAFAVAEPGRDAL
jgi:hypothetical protein